jgi:formate hydrogenlyase transcriptional activator
MGAKLQVLHGDDHGPGIIEEGIAAILSTVDLQAVLDRTGRLLRKHFGETRVSLHRIAADDPTRIEAVLVHDPRNPGQAVGGRMPLDGSAAGRAIVQRQPFVLENLDAGSPRYREEAIIARLGYGSLACFPLLFEDAVLGTLDIAHLPKHGLMECCLSTARQLSRLTAMALHNSLMVEEVRRLNRLLDQENALLREELRQIRKDGRYVAESPEMRLVMERLKLVAPSDTTVLIRGETGTGKEGLARAVHDFGPRFGAPFVAVNLGAIPETLIESELFGHEKGAFTGATRRKAGKFEQAEGGTLFLDEVGDAPPAVQVRLLRVLQEREVQRVGGTEPVPVNVRVVAATNRDLEAMVRAGTFREDLYYRLNVFPILLPPLRERREDIRPLARWFLSRHAAAMHRKPPEVPEAAFRALEAYPWPGNVRELENFLQRALILSPGPVLVLPELPGTTASSPAPVSAASGPAVPRPWDEEMRDLLTRALEACEGRVYGPAGAAALLGLKPTTLQGKLKKYGVDPRPADFRKGPRA